MGAMEGRIGRKLNMTFGTPMNMQQGGSRYTNETCLKNIPNDGSLIIQCMSESIANFTIATQRASEL